MTSSDYISILSVIVAITAFLYSYLTNTKKYELTYQYRTEILDWYAETIEILLRLKFEAKNNFNDEILHAELLAKLSAKIEIGRFYFPNIIKNDGFGHKKPTAYKGYRNLTLDFLVYSYNIFKKKDAKKYLKHAEELQKHFTSQLFEILNPRLFLKETKKYTNKTFSKELRFEDYIEKSPEQLVEYI